jgi:hypothetical protein
MMPAFRSLDLLSLRSSLGAGNARDQAVRIVWTGSLRNRFGGDTGKRDEERQNDELR